jgi:hypothetical protein
MLFTLSARSSAPSVPSSFKRMQAKRHGDDLDLDLDLDDPSPVPAKILRRGNDQEASLTNLKCSNLACTDCECEYRRDPEAAVLKSLDQVAAASPDDPTLLAEVLPALLTSVCRVPANRDLLLVCSCPVLSLSPLYFRVLDVC